MRKLFMVGTLAIVALCAMAACWEAGFREGQLKASLGVRYYWYDANGDEVADPTLSLGRTR